MSNNRAEVTKKIIGDIVDVISERGDLIGEDVLSGTMFILSLEKVRKDYCKKLKKTTNKFTIEKIQKKIDEIDDYFLNLPIYEGQSVDGFDGDDIFKLIGYKPILK